MYIDQPQLLRGVSVQVFLDGFTYASHGDYDVFRVRSAIIVEETVRSSQFIVDLFQEPFHNSREVLIVGIGSFSGLEENIRILGAAVDLTVEGMKTVPTELLQSFRVCHGF